MKVALFGRHESPAQHIVWPDGLPDDKMTDYDYMQKSCVQWIDGNVQHSVYLFVEGFTPALIAFLKAWDYEILLHPRYNFQLTLFHYQPDGSYKSQEWLNL